MPLSQLQGLNPLGGSSGYGMGRPPNADGTGGTGQANDDEQQPRRRPQNTGAPSSLPAPSSGSAAPAPTFAQLQQQGRARPAPPAPGQSQPNAPQPQSTTAFSPTQSGLSGQMEASASQALANPSAYAAPQVQQAMDTLNQSLATQATLGRQQIDETMAARGLYDSTETGKKYGLLQAQQDQSRAQYATQLAQQAALSYGQDRALALQNAALLQNQQFSQQAAGYGLNLQGSNQNFQNQLASAQFGQGQYQFGQQQGLAQQAQNLNAALGYGGLALQQGSLTGSLNGQQTLGAQQLAQQGSQFQQSLGLQSQLGLGQLGISQQQANTQQAGTLGNLQLGQQQLAQQGSQFGQSMSEQQRQFNTSQALAQQQFGLQQQLGLGQLGVAQQQANTQQAGTLGNLQLGQQQLGQQASQFGQTFGLQQLQNQQQYGLSQQQLALQSALGYGNLGVAQKEANTQAQSVANQYNLGLGNLGVSQGQLSLAQLANQQNYGLQNRGLDLQGAYQQAQIGLGQAQVNASLLNQQRQVLGNLAYAGILNSTADHPNAPPQDWINFLTGGQGQVGGLYNPPGGSYGGYSSNGAIGGYSPNGSASGVSSALGYSPSGNGYSSGTNGGYNGGSTLSAPVYNFPPAASGTQTINYGGQQYTPEQFNQLMNANVGYNQQAFATLNQQANTQRAQDNAARMAIANDPANTPYTPQGNDYGFAQAGGHTLADWQAYQTSPQYKAMQWASTHPGQPYPSTPAAFSPSDGRSVSQYIQDAGFDPQNVQVGSDGSIMDATTGKTLRGANVTPPATGQPAQMTVAEQDEAVRRAVAMGLTPADIGLPNYDF